MSEQNKDAVASITQTQLAALMAEIAELKNAALQNSVVVRQTVAAPMQVMALPTGTCTAKCHWYTEYYPVYKLIDPANPKSGFVLQTSGQYAGRPKSFGFKKQNRKEIVITWANGAEVRFMVTQDSPKVHDSRTPTMRYDEAHVVSELKRVMGDDVKAIKGAKWLMNVTVYDKAAKDAATLYGKSKVAGFVTYGKLYGKKAAQPRATVANVAASVPLAATVDGDIPF